MTTYLKRLAFPMGGLKTRALSLVLAMLASTALQAQVISLNIVGYYFRPMSPGVNLVANQFLNYSGNPLALNESINLVLTNGVPDGAMFTKWTGSAFLPTAVFDAGSLTWSLDYTLGLGDGGYLTTPSAFAAIFVGEVANYPPVGSLIWAPNYGPGLHLVSSPMPLSGPLSTMFTNVVGRLPAAGESVWLLNETTQVYSHSSFDGFAWDVDANLNVGQAAWFDIGGTGLVPPAVPEPSSIMLALLGATLLIARRTRR